MLLTEASKTPKSKQKINKIQQMVDKLLFLKITTETVSEIKKLLMHICCWNLFFLNENANVWGYIQKITNMVWKQRKNNEAFLHHTRKWPLVAVKSYLEDENEGMYQWWTLM